MYKPSTASLFLSFFRLGLTAFGGPAMIAYIRELSINHKQWLDNNTFKDGITLCQSIPGATAMQMAAYVGLKARGITGALASYTGFGLPAFILMLIFSIMYYQSRNISQIISVFNGLQVIVVAIVANALYTFGKSTIKSYKEFILSAVSGTILWLGISPFMVVAGAAVAGIVLYKGAKSQIQPIKQQTRSSHTAKQLSLFLFLLFAGLVTVYFVNTNLFQLSLMMLKIDLFAFGGGFGSLPLMLHEIVHVKGWIDYRTFMDGIALGQVTPGPIVITATFVGYLTHGLAGAIVATIAIFTPSFLILIGVSPLFERLKTSSYFQGATKGILASFVGLLLFVTLKFLLNVEWNTLKILLGFAAFIALLNKVEVLYIVLCGALISIILM